MVVLVLVLVLVLCCLFEIIKNKQKKLIITKYLRRVKIELVWVREGDGEAL